VVAEIERSWRRARERGRFRLVHYSIQRDHVHLIVEAASERDLACGMKSLAARLGRAVNRVLGRRGPILSDRYHARIQRTPREVRNAIVYVLLNARRQAWKVGRRIDPWLQIDPASSGRWFPAGAPGTHAPRSARRRCASDVAAGCLDSRSARFRSPQPARSGVP
jgi:REP element-mobilizing transposase RayT